MTKLFTHLPDFDHVIWDVDGTILNSEPIHATSVIKTCAADGVHIDKTDLHQFLGKSHFDTYKRIIEHTSYCRPFEEWLEQTIEHYSADLETVEMRQDVLDVLNMLDSEGIQQSIFSNNPGSVVFPTADKIERLIGKKGFFQQVLSLDGTQASPANLARKPAPDGYLFALELLETTAEKCLVIEDSPTGTMAGTRAGIFTLSWAHGNEKQLLEAGSNLIISDNLMDGFITTSLGEKTASQKN